MKKSSTTPISDSIAKLHPSKTFNYHQAATITCLDFDDSGQYLISSGIDKSIQLYDVHKGVHIKDIQLQKYGAHLAKFTHHDLNCLYASTPTSELEIDHAIRYLSLSDKKYLQYFRGHKHQVIDLEVNPVYDTFISSSIDGSIKIWDLKSPTPIGSLDVGGPSLVAFDPHGVVFVVAELPRDDCGGRVLFYSANNFQNGAFLSVAVAEALPGSSSWCHVEMANSGKLVLISTESGDHLVLDSFLGQLLTRLPNSPGFSTSNNGNGGGIKSLYPTTGSSCFSPCGRYVLLGAANHLLLYDLGNIKSTSGTDVVKPTDNPKRLLPFTTLETNQGLPRLVKFNPKLLTLATADNTVSLWLV